jgi:hypothetical protein
MREFFFIVNDECFYKKKVYKKNSQPWLLFNYQCEEKKHIFELQKNCFLNKENIILCLSLDCDGFVIKNKSHNLLANVCTVDPWSMIHDPWSMIYETW